MKRLNRNLLCGMPRGGGRGRVRKLTVVVAALLCAFFGVFAGGASVPPGTVVMSGLDNPRGLAFGPEGALYVAEAGRGGPGPCIVLRGAPQCYGPTGAVTRLWRGEQERIATGLPSYGSAASTTGPHDISFLGRGGGYVTIGLGFEGQPRSALAGVGDQFGWLVHLPASGGWRPVADIAAYEFAANPGGGPLDSNPYGLLAEPGSRVVADAGANALLRVAANGTVSTVAVFAARPNPTPVGPPFVDSVPVGCVNPVPPGNRRLRRTGLEFLHPTRRVAYEKPHRLGPRRDLRSLGIGRSAGDPIRPRRRRHPRHCRPGGDRCGRRATRDA